MTYRFRLTPLLLALLVALSLIPAGPARAQDSGITMRAMAAYGGAYRPGSWFPVYLELENSGVDRTVEVRVGARTGTQYAALVELPNSGRKSVTVFVHLSTPTRRITARLLSDGAELLTTTVDLQPAASRARMVAVLAGPAGAPRLPARLPDGAAVRAVNLGTGELPVQALGLSSFDTVVLDDLATSELSPPQLDALAEWVLRGGQLLVSGGPGAARVLAGLPEPLRLAEIAAVETQPASALLGPDAAGDLPLARFQPRPNPDGRAPYPLPLPALSADQPLLIEQTYGRGVVTLFAAPLGHPAILAWPDQPRLWADLLRPPASLPNGFAPEGVSVDSFIEGNLATTLTGLPALEFPPLITLGILLVIYILLVGPGTYLLLRRLDSQSLGWVVVPLITLVFAGLAYGVGYAQRGGDVLLNQVTLVESLDDSSGVARVRSFVGLFSPTRSSYSLVASAPGAAAAPMLRPISLQGPWDNNTGSTSGVFVQDGPGGPQAREFEVAQWSMRAITADTVGSYTGISSRVVMRGGELHAEVFNRGERLLEDVAVVQGDKVARLGNIPPGERREGVLKQRPNPGGGPFGSTAPLSYLIYTEEMDQGSKMGGQPLPVEIQLRVRLLDAYFAYGPAARDGQPLLLAWSREPGLALEPVGERASLQHMAMITARPRIEADAAELDLGQGWFAPRYDIGQNSVCYGGMGAGVSLGADPAQVILTLPRDFYGLRPTALTLITGADGAWLPEYVVELYDWTTGQWTAQPAAGQPLDLSEPERYLSSGGQVRVRLSTTLSQPNFGCVYVDVKVKGTLP